MQIAFQTQVFNHAKMRLSSLRASQNVLLIYCFAKRHQVGIGVSICNKD